jgi:hypothetical protein
MAGFYPPRHPERTVLYQVLFHHFDRFLTEYESRFEREYGYLISNNHLESREFIRMDYCLLYFLLLDAAPVDLLKCDGFLAKILIYIPSATICRQGKESFA